MRFLLKKILPFIVSVSTFMVSHDTIHYIIVAKRPELKFCDLSWGISLEIITWSYVLISLILIFCVGRTNRYFRLGIPEVVSFLVFTGFWVIDCSGYPNRMALVCFSALFGLIMHYLIRIGWRSKKEQTG